MPRNNGDAIAIRGAREHNLQNIDLDLPRNRFVVITGMSGSGKSTLAFDILFAEGQRRFLDSMNAYARQFVQQFNKPDVDRIEGIPPTVSIEQRTSRGGGKSTVATVTEIYQFLRLLFARTGIQYCPDCQIPVTSQSTDDVVLHLKQLAKAHPRRRGQQASQSQIQGQSQIVRLLAPVIVNRKGFHSPVAELARRQGYAALRADGKIVPADQPFRLDRFKEHDVEIVTGALGPGDFAAGKIAGTRRLIEQTLRLGKGTLYALDVKDQETIHSTQRVCASCRASFDPLDPKLFSYNSSHGWCQSCRGFGELFYLPDVDRGARADAIENSWFEWQEGDREPCPECDGTRLNQVARAVRLPYSLTTRTTKATEPFTIDSFATMSVSEALGTVKALKIPPRDRVITDDILSEIRERLHFLETVGLDYLQLGRAAPTLSGGESQRIRLAAQLGSNLSGVLYVLDEPTIGLHAHDNQRLLKTLKALRQRGNSIIVVEHDDDTMRAADHIIDLGPGAGIEGGRVTATGTFAQLKRNPQSTTGRAFRSQRRSPSRSERRSVRLLGRRGPTKNSDPGLWLSKASKNNLKDLSVAFPLQRFVVVTGLSGSGKSTLIRECLLPELTQQIQRRAKKSRKGPKTSALRGFESIHAVYEVDQSPIGRTPRSTPATYVGFFDEVRRLFAQAPEARMRGYGPGRFSFNSPQGRCPECKGAGAIKVEMNFMPAGYVPCDTCEGTRYSPETLDISYRQRNIAQVLDLSIAEAREFFDPIPKIRKPLDALIDTGLGYLKLGQTSPTLSGGEAQRVKLVSHLLTGLQGAGKSPVPPGRSGTSASASTRSNVFILEEPTIGLHSLDVSRLIQMIQRLVDSGHTVIVIEHNLELIAEADWVLDLGPGGGEAGGRLVASGTPEAIADCSESLTGRYLKSHL